MMRMAVLCVKKVAYDVLDPRGLSKGPHRETFLSMSILPGIEQSFAYFSEHEIIPYIVFFVNDWRKSLVNN